MKIIKIKNCNECPYFDTEMAQEGKGNHVFDILAICLKHNGRVIENKGCKAFEKGLEATTDITNVDEIVKIENKIYDDDLKNNPTSIPNWCPLEKED